MHTLAPAAQELFAKGLAAQRAGDGTAAEGHYRACLAADPKCAAAAFNLGMLLLNRGATAEAEPLVRTAVTLQPTVDTVTGLALVFTASGRQTEAEQCYRDILKSIPTHAPTLQRMAELCDQKSDRRGASSYYKRAWDADPANIGCAINYAVAIFNDDPAETVRVMDTLVAAATDDAIRLKVLTSLLLYKEFHERMKRGLMPYHATSLDELFFTYCAADFELYKTLSFRAVEQNPNDIGAFIRKFTACFCARDRKAAQLCLDKFAPLLRNHVWTTVTFDPAFYRTLEQMTDTDLLKGLPPLQDIVPQEFADLPVAYLSCNFTYFASFAVPMIRSLADKSAGAQLHIHIMDATDEQLAQAAAFCQHLPTLRVAISAERPEVDKQGMANARAYYHAIRFIRYYQHLAHYGRTLWLMDVDALFNRDPHEMYAMLGDKDAAFRIRAGRFEPWNQFNACIVAATAKPASLRYFRLVAAYIAHFYQRGGLQWGIDQFAMYGVHEYLRDEGRAPTLAFLDTRAIDYDYLDEGIVWCNSGKNKFFHLKRKPDGSLIVDDPDRARYLQLFDKYYLPGTASA